MLLKEDCCCYVHVVGTVYCNCDVWLRMDSTHFHVINVKLPGKNSVSKHFRCTEWWWALFQYRSHKGHYKPMPFYEDWLIYPNVIKYAVLLAAIENHNHYKGWKLCVCVCVSVGECVRACKSLNTPTVVSKTCYWREQPYWKQPQHR